MAMITDTRYRSSCRQVATTAIAMALSLVAILQAHTSSAQDNGASPEDDDDMFAFDRYALLEKRNDAPKTQRARIAQPGQHALTLQAIITASYDSRKTTRLADDKKLRELLGRGGPGLRVKLARLKIDPARLLTTAKDCLSNPLCSQQ